MQVSLASENTALVLDLLSQLKRGAAPVAAPTPAPAAAKERPHDKEARAAWRAERAAEAQAADKAARRKEKEHAAALKEAFAADAAAAAVVRREQQPKVGGSVRVTIGSADKPSERKLVVLARSPDLTELLKAGKAKLRLKKAAGARLAGEGGRWVRSAAELADGDVVLLTTEAAPAEEEPGGGGNGADAPAANLSRDSSSSVAGEKGDEEEVAAEADTKVPAEASESAAAELSAAEAEQRAAPTGAAAVVKSRRRATLPQRLGGDAAVGEQRRLAVARPPEGMATARAALPLASLAEEAVGAISSRGGAALQRGLC